MVEKLWACRKCQWVPKNRDEESRICPKCGQECTHEDFLTDERDLRIWREDLMRDNKGFRQID